MTARRLWTEKWIKTYLDSVLRFIEKICPSKVTQNRVHRIFQHIVSYNGGKVWTLQIINQASNILIELI